MFDKIDINELPTLDLHGVSSDKAKMHINRIIEINVRLKFQYMVIIHGKGAAILKKNTHEALRCNKYVEEYKSYWLNDGMTIVKLKLNKNIKIVPFVNNLKRLFKKTEVLTKKVKELTELYNVKSISINHLFGLYKYEIDFEKNNVFVIHAPNGCGKSTFLKCINYMINMQNDTEKLFKMPFSLLKIKTDKVWEFSCDNFNRQVKLCNNSDKKRVPIFSLKCNYIDKLYEYNIENNLLNLEEKREKLFNEIMNDFFCYEKSIQIKDGKLKIKYLEDYIVNVPNVYKKDDDMKFDDLSSGEQFIVKLFHKFIYNLNYNSFVILDEPEISLHVEWQEIFIDWVVKIAEQYDLKILIATHSPYMINNSNVSVGCVENEEKL